MQIKLMARHLREITTTLTHTHIPMLIHINANKNMSNIYFEANSLKGATNGVK